MASEGQCRHLMSSARLFLLGLCAIMIAAGRSPDRGTFFLAGEPIRFDASMSPQFTDNQLRNTAEATREGLARWAATPYGQKLIAYLGINGCEIVVTEDLDEQAAGRAPQPGIATLAAASNHSRRKIYGLILNPTFFKIPQGVTPVPWSHPANPAEMMAAAWAGEMLHIYFYAQGISLPHHERSDFQQEWQIIAAELGMPGVRHDDEDGHAATFGRSLVIRR
jgi:hypothetical protein